MVITSIMSKYDIYLFQNHHYFKWIVAFNVIISNVSWSLKVPFHDF
jgi:hypothetical protein